MTASIRRGLALALCVTALARVAHSQTPQRLTNVPLPPGARADTLAEGYNEPPCWSEECRTYLIPSAIEDVFRFYQQRLAARSSGEADVDAARNDALADLSPGGVTPVFHQTRTWREWLESAPPAARQAWEPRMALVRSRTPYRPNEWLAWAKFAWGARRTEGEVALAVTISDVTEPGVGPRTRVMIESQSWEDVAEAEPPDEPMEEPVEEEAVPLVPPSERELGVPLYPGARFDANMSGQLSSGGDAKYFVYTTGDDPATVLRFYQQRTGKKAEMENEAGSLIVVRGTAPWPDLGVTIQPNMGTYAPTVKTMITIRKSEGGE